MRSTVDDATARLILQLQNRDFEELIHAGKGKSKDGKLSDTELAVAPYRQELQKMRMILID